MNIVCTSSRAFWNACCTVGDKLVVFDISLFLAGVLDLLFVLLVADGILNICLEVCSMWVMCFLTCSLELLYWNSNVFIYIVVTRS